MAGRLVDDSPDLEALRPDNDGRAPASVLGLMTNLRHAPHGVVVHRVGPHRYIGYLGGPETHSALGPGGSVTLLAADVTTYTREVARAIDAVIDGDPDAHVMLVGTGAGGVVAAELAAASSERFVVDQVVTAGAPAAHVPRLPEGTHMLALEDRSDPVALLGSLVNAGDANRTTVVFDAGRTRGEDTYVAGGRAADQACGTGQHPELLTALDRMRTLGYLTA
jgi:pimeloyl-ACP methyl ester carboxylesterase